MITLAQRKANKKVRKMINYDYKVMRIRKWLNQPPRYWLPDVWEEEPLPCIDADVLEAHELLEMHGGVISTYGLLGYALAQRFEKVGDDHRFSMARRL